MKTSRIVISIVIVILCLTACWIAWCFSGKGDGGNVDQKDSLVDRLIFEIQHLKETASGRDSIIDNSHDTIIYRTNTVSRLVTEYRTEYDTVYRLRICDSLVIQADKLQKECLFNDSIHRTQERDKDAIITKQDTLIEYYGDDNDRLRRRNKIWKVSTGGLGAVVAVLLIRK